MPVAKSRVWAKRVPERAEVGPSLLGGGGGVSSRSFGVKLAQSFILPRSGNGSIAMQNHEPILSELQILS